MRNFTFKLLVLKMYSVLYLLCHVHFVCLCCGLYSICIWPTPIYVDKSKRRVAVKVVVVSNQKHA